ncbi:MAG TPA: two-component regulator propeller domain-containing protein [Verrucomicrobiae bacterium]|nr:two-component regulator propeller domain-containing protein [Verrucomicrobiae bacterium]
MPCCISLSVFRRRMLTTLIGLCLWRFLPAASAAQFNDNYITRTWQSEQGLPQNKVTAVMQAADGYLWIGTYNGLARFDGVRFTVLDQNNMPQLRSSRITSLFESEDGALWIGAESGDISQYKGGRLTAVPLYADWSGGKIYAIAADNAGDVWVVNQSGELARVRDGEVLSPPSGGVSNVISVARSQEGTIWIGRDGAVSALKDGQMSAPVFTNLYVQGFCAARGGGFWVACSGGVRKWKEGKWVADLGAAPWGWSIVPSLMETSSGVLAGGTSGDGLWLIFTRSTNTPPLHFDRANGLPSDWVISLCEDREQNLWCGTGEGLVLIRPSIVATVSPPDKWRSCPVLSVLPASNGTLWVGTEGAGLYRLQNGEWTNFDNPQGIRNPYVWSLAADKTGRIWAGTWGGGLFELKDDRFVFAPGLENLLSPMPALLFSGDCLWIGTPGGPVQYHNGQIQQISKLDGKPFGDTRVIAKDPAGGLWCGTAGNGLVLLRDGKLHRFKTSDGLSSDFIECLYFGDDNALWIGTFGGGLDRFKDGKFSVISRAEGLPNSVIGHIESDGLGYFWMSSYAGIFRASEKDLNLCANGEVTNVSFLTYGTSEGMPTIECSEGLQSAGCKTPDGHLWFATAKGLVSIYPPNVTTNSLPPPVVIESMLMDDQPFSAPFNVPPGKHRIEFEYTGLSFVSPEKVQFKCRLNNLEAEWVDAGTKRTATYNYIPPGNYSFQVTACNNDGVWNQAGASLSFSVLPFFWQTFWFRMLTGITIVTASSGLAWFGTRRRMRRKLERLEWQRAVEHERARIAHDIHDDLGAHLTRISMLSETIQTEMDEPERAVAGLNQIYKTAHELTRAMDEIVWAVNPRHDTLEGLTTYLERFAQDLLASAGIRCRLDMPSEFPSWRLTAEVRHNVFLAFKESLHNVVKHSAASETFIRLVTSPSSFELVVRDNGRGFSSGATRNSPEHSTRIFSGNGLENMARRMDAIGGHCRIESAPGQGTTVSFIVPLRKYAASSFSETIRGR